MIEIAQGGERNQLRLIDGALAQFAEPSGSGAAPI
jgi:hypothetical protein